MSNETKATGREILRIEDLVVDYETEDGVIHIPGFFPLCVGFGGRDSAQFLPDGGPDGLQQFLLVQIAGHHPAHRLGPLSRRGGGQDVPGPPLVWPGQVNGQVQPSPIPHGPPSGRPAARTPWRSGRRHPG